MNQLLKEAPVYLAVGISSLLVMCFVVHAMVGGLVSIETEYILYALVCLIDIIVMLFMAKDVIRQRKQQAERER